jgi:hypothetical protein
MYISGKAIKPWLFVLKVHPKRPRDFFTIWSASLINQKITYFFQELNSRYHLVFEFLVKCTLSAVKINFCNNHKVVLEVIYPIWQQISISFQPMFQPTSLSSVSGVFFLKYWLKNSWNLYVATEFEILNSLSNPVNRFLIDLHQ